jgi:hypothetical protein
MRKMSLTRKQWFGARRAVGASSSRFALYQSGSLLGQSLAAVGNERRARSKPHR